jgi:hypothetical protein
MTQYAYFDSTQPAPQPVLGWYDTVAYPGVALPPAQDLLLLTPQQWNVSRTGNYWSVDAGQLVQFFAPLLSNAGVPQTDVNGNLILPGVVVPAVAVFTPVSGATITIPNNVSTVYIQGSTALASLTIDLPVAPVDNQELVIIFQVAVTALTLTPAAGYTSLVSYSGVSVSLGSRITSQLDGTVWC